MQTMERDLKKKAFFSVAVQQCGEFATYADVQCISSVFFMLWQCFLPKPKKSHLQDPNV